MSDQSKTKPTPKEAKRRVFLSGPERAEYEHVYGPLQSDPHDPRFVLVDAETEEKIDKLPPGIPPLSSQPFDQREKINEAIQDATGSDDVPDPTSKKPKASDK